jgi:AAA domain
MSAKGWLPALFRPVSAAVEAAAQSQETRGAVVPTVSPPPPSVALERTAQLLDAAKRDVLKINPPRLVLGVDATYSRAHAWNMAKRLTSELFDVLPGELEVALAVHGGGRVHTFTPFVSEAVTLRRIADRVRCKAGETAMLDILERVAATDRVRVVVYIGDSFEESEVRARRLAKLLRNNETRVIILADCGNRPFFVLEPFQMIASITGGAVLPFDVAADTRHEISNDERAAVLRGDRFKDITREQVLAYRHATGKEGLSIIDGQAGTGKSFTLAAIRETYEKAGYRVIGLAPTNAVAQDMRADGFSRAGTVHSELFALNNNRTSWDRRTVVMVDEAAMLDTKLMAMITAHAHEAGAKLILAGDDRQLSSIERGGMFGALKDRHGAAELSEVKRQHKLDERRAAEMMARGNFHDALNIYEQKGAIHWTRTQGEARAALVAQWAKDSAATPDKSRFVFAYTNDEVNQLNAALRDVRKQRGELGEDRQFTTAHGRAAFAAGDRIQFTGTNKKAGIANGNAGIIEKIEGGKITVKLDGRKPQTLTFDATEFQQFRHGYAGTIYRGQGRTLDQTYLYHSEHWRSAASYVALTRHRDKAELFVARNTAADVKQLARQVARVDDRRAASMFYHHADLGPIRPLTARETLEKFGGQWLRRPGSGLRPQQADIVEPRQQKDQPEARRMETRGDDQQMPAADTQRRAQERQQQANESDRTETTLRNNPEQARSDSRGGGRGRGRTR